MFKAFKRNPPLRSKLLRSEITVRFLSIISRVMLNRIIYISHDDIFFSSNNTSYLIIILNYMKYSKCALIRTQFIFDNCFLIVSAIHRRLQIPVNYLQIWGAPDLIHCNRDEICCAPYTSLRHTRSYQAEWMNFSFLDIYLYIFESRYTL